MHWWMCWIPFLIMIVVFVICYFATEDAEDSFKGVYYVCFFPTIFIVKWIYIIIKFLIEWANTPISLKWKVISIMYKGLGEFKIVRFRDMYVLSEKDDSKQSGWKTLTESKIRRDTESRVNKTESENQLEQLEQKIREIRYTRARKQRIESMETVVSKN